MDSAIVGLTRCTTCDQGLRMCSAAEASATGEVVKGSLVCPAGHKWPVEGGVLVFTREDAPSDPWPRKDAEYETYCRNQERWLPEAAGQVASLLETLTVESTGVVLDLCTGAGGLLFPYPGERVREVLVKAVK